MTCDSSIEGVERASRARAIIMATAGAILPFNAWLQFGDPDYVAPGVRGASWIVLIGLWTIVFANGGGLRLRGRMRQLLNDELSLRNRGRALAAGFYVMLAAALAIYVAAWRIEIVAGDAIKLATAAGLSAALLVYAWLEWN